MPWTPVDGSSTVGPIPASSVLFRPRPGGGRIAGGKGLLVGFLQLVSVIIGAFVGLRGHIIVNHANAPLSGASVLLRCARPATDPLPARAGGRPNSEERC